MTKPIHGSPAPELSSPACSMHEADDVYMGYAGREEILRLLMELLLAEEAAGRVLVRAGEGAEAAGLFREQAAHGAALLRRHIQALGGIVPSESAVLGEEADVGQWSGLLDCLSEVTRRLRDMLPRLRDDRLHAELGDMLRLREAEIGAAKEIAGRGD